MDDPLVAVAFRPGHPYTSGRLHLFLGQWLHDRYRCAGGRQPGYEIAIETRRGLIVKRARQDGRVLSLGERVRLPQSARIAAVTTQPFISNLLPSLIDLTPTGIPPAECQRLLHADIEWRVVATEQFHSHFLQRQATVHTTDILAAIAGALRLEWLQALQPAPSTAAPLRSSDPPLSPAAWARLAATLVEPINQRIAATGVAIQRFYAPAAMPPVLVEADVGLVIATLANCRARLRGFNQPAAPSLQTQQVGGGLLAHLGQELSDAKTWLVDLINASGFELTAADLQAALDPAPAVLSVVSCLHRAGWQQLEAANRTRPWAVSRRNDLQRRAQAFFDLALLLLPATTLRTAATSAGAPAPALERELRALLQQLDLASGKSTVAIAVQPGSTIYVMAAAPLTPSSAGPDAAGLPASFQFAPELLPLLDPNAALTGEAALLTPTAAAQQLDFEDADQTTSLVLQVLEPSHSETGDVVDAPTSVPGSPVSAPGEPVFWRWPLQTTGAQFKVRLRPAIGAGRFDLELQGADFLTAQQQRSTELPSLPHLRLRYEPVEIALLIDGYWLTGQTNVPHGRSSLDVLIDLLDHIDAAEQRTQRGMLLHAAICLDQHIAPQFLAAHEPPSVLYSLQDAPINTTAQFIDEWLLPWVDRWRAWQVKPYPQDTDIALEQGFRYLSSLRWTTTLRPEQRAVVVCGRSRPHDHALYFTGVPRGDRVSTAPLPAPGDLPYCAEDRFSVSDIDWRTHLGGLRSNVGTILALADPGLPNPRYKLPVEHPLMHEYRQFWATVDADTRNDIDDTHNVHSSERGLDRVAFTLEERLFQRRAILHCEPPLWLPLAAQPLPAANGVRQSVGG